MQTVTIKLTDRQARWATMILRERYGKDGRTNLNKLAKIALLMEIADESEKDLIKAEKELEQELEEIERIDRRNACENPRAGKIEN